jgi:hypothetical protein
MPPLPEAIILGLAPSALLCSRRVWRLAPLLLLGAILRPEARTVVAALRATGLATKRRFTNDHWVLHRATWSPRPGSRMPLGLLVTLLVPPEATVVLGRVTPWDVAADGKSTPKGALAMPYASPNPT